jgi:hypothetical protein
MCYILFLKGESLKFYVNLSVWENIYIYIYKGFLKQIPVILCINIKESLNETWWRKPNGLYNLQDIDF